MKRKIEFFNSPDGVINFRIGEEPVKQFDESCKEVINEIIGVIRDLYPEALSALSEIYSKSMANKPHFEYRIAHRFIRCNFGEFDSLSYDLDETGAFNFEYVKCPLRGECKHEGIICMPTMKTELSQREMEVVTLLLKGCDKIEIADELDLSIYTVTRHLSNIRHRLKLKSTSQIITFFKK